jgi:4-amino-4-deoxy-L-arabinose transferase-like glycosyltransferase
MQANQPSPFRGLLWAYLLLGVCAALEYLFHWLVVPVLFAALCVWLLACRFVEWVVRHPALHRLLAAFVLLFCRPRPIDSKLYHFCYPDHA